MAAKAAGLALLAVALLIAATAARAEASAGKEELATALQMKNGHGAISEPEGFKECFNAIVASYDCLQYVLKAAYFGVGYLSKECCNTFFVKVGEDCVLAALRYLYPFKDGLTQELKEFCSTVG